MNLANSFPLRAARLVCATLLIAPAIALGQGAIESGQYFSGSLPSSYTTGSTNMHSYVFQAEVDDTVIIRVANNDDYEPFIPDVFVTYIATIPSPSTNISIVIATNPAAVSAHEMTETLTRSGWYRIDLSVPTWGDFVAIPSLLDYSVSILRIPGYPLSYADLDVGPILSGESLTGEINVGADLDAATLSVTNNSTVLLRMGQKEVQLVPVLRVFGPSGESVSNAVPVEYRSELVFSLTNAGIYTVVCNDQLNANGQYAISMVQIPSTLMGEDLDLGTIIPGETFSATIDEPGNMDVATFMGSADDEIRLSMTEVDVAVAPVLLLYDPAGNLIKRATDIMQVSAVITTNIPANGLYTVVCMDKEDRYGVSYTLTLELLSGSSTSSIPEAPTSVSATDGVHADRVTVTWYSVGGANGYDVWRSYGTNAAIQLCTNLTALAYDDYDVVSGQKYYYKVKARNDYGVGEFSTSDSGYSGTIVLSSERRALLVGLNKYSAAYAPGDLNACIADAEGIRDTMLLGDPSNRWASANIQMLTNAQATKVSIRGALMTLASASEAGDLVLYYHSGHGGQTAGSNPSNTFICAYDSDYTDSDLASDLAAFQSEVSVIIIIDTCFSAGMFKSTDGVPDWPFAKNVMAAYKKIKTAEFAARGEAVPKTLGNNIGFMTACDYNEVSWENADHGLYTGFLLDGCSISAVDTNEDGQLQFMELHDYAKTEAAVATEGEYQQNAQSYNNALLASTIARTYGAAVPANVAGLDNDYDGDGISDLVLYHEETGGWYIFSLQNGVIAWDLTFGGPGFIPITGDYNGDGTADLTVYHEASGLWYIWSMTDGPIAWGAQWGGPGLTPIAGDYSGNGVSDLTLYEKNAGFWYSISLSGQPIIVGKSFAGSGFTAVPGDYDGDNVADCAMCHDASGYWFVASSFGTPIIWGIQWGEAGYEPVPGDYDGDAVFDLTVYCRYTGLWYSWSEVTSTVIAWGTAWGGPEYIPVAGDYDGDGTSDLVVYNETTGAWYIRSLDGTKIIAAPLMFGGTGFVPVQSTW